VLRRFSEVSSPFGLQRGKKANYSLGDHRTHKMQSDSEVWGVGKMGKNGGRGGVVGMWDLSLECGGNKRKLPTPPEENDVIWNLTKAGPFSRTSVGGATP